MDELLLLAGLALLFAGGGGDSDSPSSPGSGGGGGDDVGPGTNKQKLWAQLRSTPELTETQRYFMMLTAAGESNFNPKAHNDSESEVQASRNAFKGALATKLRACGFPDGAWTIGSGGRFGRLVPYFGDDWDDLYNECIDPKKLFVSPYDLISALKNARALQEHDAFRAKPTVGTLRLGWYGPGAMKAPQDPERLEKYRRKAIEESLPSGIVDAHIENFPSLAAIRVIGKRLLSGIGPELPPPQGPIDPAAVPQPWQSRAMTTDVTGGAAGAGFRTESWYFVDTHGTHGRVWIRVDAHANVGPGTGVVPGAYRWVVFDHAANVRKFDDKPRHTNAAGAADLATEWVRDHS
jgi:hypothetical protein